MEDDESGKPSSFHKIQNLPEYRVQTGLPNPDAKYSFSWKKDKDGTYIYQSSTNRNHERDDEVTMNGLTLIEVSRAQNARSVHLKIIWSNWIWPDIRHETNPRGPYSDTLPRCRAPSPCNVYCVALSC